MKLRLKLELTLKTEAKLHKLAMYMLILWILTPALSVSCKFKKVFFRAKYNLLKSQKRYLNCRM